MHDRYLEHVNSGRLDMGYYDGKLRIFGLSNAVEAALWLADEFARQKVACDICFAAKSPVREPRPARESQSRLSIGQRAVQITHGQVRLKTGQL